MSSSRNSWSSFIPTAAGIFLAGILLGYAGLIGLGQWQGDEYYDFDLLARNGWSTYWLALGWNPRPFTESMLFVYGWTVNHLHHPLILPFLGMLWIGLIVAGFFTSWQLCRQQPRQPVWPGTLIALALMASFMAGGELTEVFYWPAGAVGYLPTLAATLLLFLQVATGRLDASRGRLLASVCLAFAAASSEMGAAFVLGFAMVQATLLGLAALGRSSAPQDRLPILWWLFPAVFSLGLIVVVGLNRYGVVEAPAVQGSAIVGHPLLSLWHASQTLFLELAGWKAESHHWMRLSARLPAEILLATGVGLCWRQFENDHRRSNHQLAGISVAFLLASLFTIAAAYLHFGAAVGERHETIRRCWIMMSFAGLGMICFSSSALGRFRRQGLSNIVAPLLLCASVASVWHAKALFREYGNYAAVGQAIQQNFQSGFADGDTSMTYILPPDRGVLTFAQIEPGVYTLESQNEEYAVYILRYFNKKILVVRRAE